MKRMLMLGRPSRPTPPFGLFGSHRGLVGKLGRCNVRDSIWKVLAVDVSASLIRGAMKRKRKTEIIVERDQVLVIKRLEHRAPQWCEQCAAQSRMVSVDEAAAIARVSSRAVYQKVEAGQLHFAEPPDGQLRICLASLLNSI